MSWFAWAISLFAVALNVLSIVLAGPTFGNGLGLGLGIGAVACAFIGSGFARTL